VTILKIKNTVMKKFILPLVAVMIIGAATSAQTAPKQSSNKTVAIAKPKSGTKTTSSKETVTTPKTTTTSANAVAIHKKHHHHKAKKAAKK
jgi:hypothetical protein